jgi:hypothetical protein
MPTPADEVSESLSRDCISGVRSHLRSDRTEFSQHNCMTLEGAMNRLCGDAVTR